MWERGPSGIPGVMDVVNAQRVCYVSKVIRDSWTGAPETNSSEDRREVSRAWHRKGKAALLIAGRLR